MSVFKDDQTTYTGNVTVLGSLSVGGSLTVTGGITIGGGTGSINGVPIPFTTITNSMSGDVAISNAVYTDGPSIAQGTTGKWFAVGTVTFTDSATSFQVSTKLWDGTTVISSGRQQVAVATANGTISLSGYIAAPAGNIRISCTSNSATSTFKFNASGNSKDCTISAIRIA